MNADGCLLSDSTLLRRLKMRLSVRLFLFTPLLLAVACAPTFAQQKSPSGYHVVKQFKLGGDGGWDYITFDAKGNRVFISRSTHVMVVDADTGNVLGDIADTQGVHGVAVVDEFGKGYTSNGRANTVTVFDLKTLKVLKQVPVGQNPDAILYDAASKRVFTFNGRSGDSTAVDAEKGTVVGTIKLGGKPEFAVSDGKGELFVNLEDKNELLALDPAKLAVRSTWSLAPCESPSGLSMDLENRRLFSGCDKLMAIVDADSGKLVSKLPICDGVDATAYDPETRLAFASCHDGKLTVIREESPEKFSVVENAVTQPGARTMALDPKTHNVFTVTAKFEPEAKDATAGQRSRRAMVPNSFVLLEVGR
jgi:YVTN family beta-propeller protein